MDDNPFNSTSYAMVYLNKKNLNEEVLSPPILKKNPFALKYSAPEFQNVVE